MYHFMSEDNFLSLGHSSNYISADLTPIFITALQADMRFMASHTLFQQREVFLAGSCIKVEYHPGGKFNLKKAIHTPENKLVGKLNV